MYRALYAGILAVICTFSLVARADSNTAYNLAAQRLDSDSFDNYDFESERVSSTNVDQPVTLIFTNNAEKSKIYTALSGRYIFTGSMEYGRLNNSFGWFFAGTGGKKTGPGCGVWDVHYRVYGDPAHGNRMWSPSQGFYVIGTTHWDYNDGCGTAQYGWNESAEADVASYTQALGWTTYRNIWDMQNPNNGRWEGCCQYFDNNATASYVAVP